ncbi:MAG TPA: hypothetical protein VKG92_08145, partial [Flavobacteriales bacterium]|nr:hypothetical protein [Flavobacteriales bacterium]
MRTSTLLFCLGLGATASAQWSTDPANPLVVCNAANSQSHVRAISDGNGGWFVFWNDARVTVGKNELYGQHLDAEGNALWAADGLLIASHADSTVTHATPLLMPDGTLLVGYIYQSGGGYDGFVQVMHLDADGTSLWTDPVRIFHSGAGAFGNVFGVGDLAGIVVDDHAFFAWSFGPQGGNNTYAYERIDMDGNVQFGDLGNHVPNSGWGPFTIHDD